MLGTVVTLGTVGIVLFVWYFFRKNMPRTGNIFFKIGYTLYANTRLGSIYYKRQLKKARRKFANGRHSTVQPSDFNGLRIIPVPMSMDNYAYIIVNKETHTTVIIDPADPKVVQPVLEAEGLVPTAILTTHKHWDHSGGNSHFARMYPKMLIFGGPGDHVPSATNVAHDGERLEFDGLQFTVLHVPGHTVEQCVYLLSGQPYNAPDSLFSGDMVFMGGIGRMFEGNASIMLTSLLKLQNLPDDTLLWSGHEYALDNLEFVAVLDPDNVHVQRKLSWVRRKRTKSECTHPSSLGEERTYNPYLRTADPVLQELLGRNKQPHEEDFNFQVRCLAEIRARKDKFKYKL